MTEDRRQGSNSDNKCNDGCVYYAQALRLDSSNGPFAAVAKFSPSDFSFSPALRSLSENCYQNSAIRSRDTSVITLSAVLVFLIIQLSAVLSPAWSFSIPEKLHYDLTWVGIKTGEAELEVRETAKDIQIISKANSSDWASIFHRVDDIVVSTIRKGENKGYCEGFIGVPHNYRIKIHEGRYQRDKEFLMDHVAKKVTYTNYLAKEKKEFVINESTLDPLSSFYYVRMLPLEVGKSVFLDVFDSKKLYKAEVQVLKREVLETPAGTFKTVLIKPILRSEGIFFKKGDILIWLTDDSRKIPVMVKTKVGVGSVKAILVGGPQ